MRISKLKMFFILNGVIALVVAFYCLIWIFGGKATGEILNSDYDNVHYRNRLLVRYSVKGKMYSSNFLRFDVPFSQKQISISYLSFHPQSSRVNSFMGIYAEPLAWWSVILLALSMLLLTHNQVFSRGTVFEIRKKFPWISMEEYFILDEDEMEEEPRHYKKEKIKKPRQLEN